MAGKTTQESKAVEQETDEAKVLIAQSYILYNSKHYKPGEMLPANDQEMTKAWIEAGTAAWVVENKVLKAIPAAAMAGISGIAAISESEGGEDLVGRVLAAPGRRRREKP